MLSVLSVVTAVTVFQLHIVLQTVWIQEQVLMWQITGKHSNQVEDKSFR